MSNEYKRDVLLKTAFQKYSFRILQLVEESDINDNYFLRKDLLEYVHQIHVIIQNFDDPEIHWNAIFNNKELSVAALSYYISNMEESIKTTSNILGKLPMSKVEEQINSTKALIERLQEY